MANGIDPRISLAAQPINVGQRIGQTISNVANLDLLQQRREQAPFQNRLLQRQEELAIAQQPGQLQIAEEAAGPLAQLNRRDKARLQSVVQGAVELSPLLEVNDISGARSQLIARKSRLEKLGLPTETTDESIELLNTNPDLLRQRTAQAITLGRQSGFIKAPTAISATASQKDFAEFQRLQAVAQESGSPEDLKAAEQFGRQARFIGETPAQARTAKIETETTIAREKSRLEGVSTAKKLAVKKSGEAFDKIANIDVALGNFDDAIRAIDEGASTGVITSRLPSFRKSSIELDNIQKSLGLDVVGNTTFGALSESELAFALDKALPVGLQPADLKLWLQSKRSAQQKLRDHISEAAQFLGTGENTIPDWLQLQKARKIAADNAQQASAQPAQATQQPAQNVPVNLGVPPLLARPVEGQTRPVGVQIGRFTVEEIK